MPNPLFSIVIPMYNVEAFLPKCVESVRNQTLREIEIILVDDASPDCCGQMADEYAAEDSRIRVVHRSCNGGLGPARNSGMAVACGRYIGFVDSDDWVEPDMFQQLYEALERTGAQVAYSGLKTVRHGRVDLVREHPMAGQVLEGAQEIFRLRRAFYGVGPCRDKDEAIPVSVCLAGYDSSLLRKNSIEFVNVRSEDKFFNTVVCRAANRVAAIGGTPYCYRKDDQASITKTFDRKTIDSFFRLFRLLQQLADEEPEEFWVEAHVRAQRCILDYSRVLLKMIYDSSEPAENKTAFMREVLAHPALRCSCRRYPFWKLPCGQAAFYCCMKAKSVAGVRLLLKLRGKG